MKRFRKILIGNRGEIAVRIARTCRAMGIATVAVYSDADARSPHARLADEAVRIGPAPSQESYLRIEKVIEAAHRTGADAVHPGYGFLAENADFAAACEGAGLTFIGPSPDSIRKMGLKSTARKIMAEAGVPIVPGYDDADQSLESLSRRAVELEFPVLIKAAGGGGGKGMRVVREKAGLEEAIESARREAEKSFGDPTLLVEKYVEDARHIEVQILGDSFGNLIHLFERECSIQRRYQKIIEESPSQALTTELRMRICEAALKAGRAISYTNAGTVEFVLTPGGEFYFIEANTRLQVEHPVTEMITGLDLVRLQIEVAEGARLRLRQEDVKQSGHAIEARLNAEDPDNNFLPATGVIHDLNLAAPIEGLRVDTGIERNMEVGIYYDPLLAKVIAHGPDRESAIRKLACALRSMFIHGTQTNREFLTRLLDHPDFQAGRYHTGFIAEHADQLVAQKNKDDDLIAAIVAVLHLLKSRQAKNRILPHVPQNYRNNPFRDPRVALEIGGDAIDVSWQPYADEMYDVRCGDRQARVEVIAFDPGRLRVAINGVQQSFIITEAGEQLFLHSTWCSRVVKLLPRYPEASAASQQESHMAPMPGQVLKILVNQGQQISAGDPLVILEAMKMEQTLRAVMDGVVEAVLVKQGDVVAPGEVIVRIAPA
ncbi:MAG TPA: acetyl-CoA carboxylase biotin carboxylase subunit [Blastocatellia bacterium]|nr:acetyl-CoA carboxylase biotin carboxylase subunit [Blastocatellia bacterium]